jgi:hypothetical protein
VPGREPVCYCGVTRSEAPAAWRAEPEQPPRHGLSPLVVVALMAAGGLGVYAAMRIRESGRPAPMPVEASPGAIDTGTVAPPATAERSPADAPSRAPTTSTLAPMPVARPAEAPAAAVRSTPAAVETSPSPTAMEEAWSRASALLDPPLQEVASATSALIQDCAVFAYACLSSTGRNCLVSMRSGTIVANNVPRLGGGRADCDLERRRLIARADGVKAQLNQIEAQARGSGVLPGHWRRLLAAHGLEIWDEF